MLCSAKWAEQHCCVLSGSCCSSPKWQLDFTWAQRFPYVLVLKHFATPLGIKKIDVILMEDLRAQIFSFFFQSGKKIHFRWICSRQSNLTFLKGNRLSVRQVFFSVLQSGSLKIITHDWKSCSCVLNFPFFNSSPPSIFDAKQPNVGNCYSLGDTEGFQMVFMFLGTAEIWLISFSRNSGIIIISFFFSSLQLWKTGLLFWGKGAGWGRWGWEEKMNLFWLYLYFSLPS